MALLKIIFVLIFILCFIQGKAEYNNKQYTRTTTPFFKWIGICFVSSALCTTMITVILLPLFGILYLFGL